MTTIKLKNGSGAPTAGDLAQGEPALDLTNKRLYTEDSGGTVIEVGTNPGTDVTFADNRKAVFGAGSDLQIYHDGSHSYVKDNGTGNLRLQGSTTVQITDPSFTSYSAQFNPTGAATLYHNNSAKLATTATGIDVTGDITLGDTNPTITFNDSSVTNLSHTISSASDNLRIMADVNGVDAGSRVEIFDGTTEVARFEAGAVDFTGTVTADGLTVDSSSGITVNGPTNQDGKLNLVAYAGVQDAEARIQSVRGNTSGTDSRLQFLTNNGTSLLTRVDINDNGDISFYDSSGTSQSLFWDASAESLGIGNTSPTDKLHLGTSSGGTQLKIQSGSSVNNCILHTNGTTDSWRTGMNLALTDGSYEFYDDINNVDRMVIASNGNVGIGTSSPSKKFVISDGGAMGVEISPDDSGNGYSRIINYDRTTNQYEPLRIEGEILQFSTGTTATEKARLDASGNFGIGTSSPTDTLSVGTLGSGSNSIITIGASTTGTSSIYFGDGASAARFRGYFDYVHSSDHLAIGTAGTERMRIDSSGNLLVGTTTQLGQVTVNNGGSNTGLHVRQTSTSVSHVGGIIRNDYVTGGQTGKMLRFEQGTGGEVGSVTSTVTSTAYNTSSDQRLKNNIVDAPSASDDIDAIQVRSFDWKADGSHQKYGMVAQELQTVAPEAVTGDADSDEMMGVDYSKLVPMLVKEIQSLRARVAQLETN